MSEKRKYRTFSPDEKTEIVLAGLRGDRSVRDVCREYEIAETLYYQWRDRLLEGGKPPSRHRGTRTRTLAMASSATRRSASRSWSGRWGARPTSWRSRGNSRGSGREITAYIDTYHHRPRSGIGYRTPAEVAQTWRTLQTRAT